MDIKFGALSLFASHDSTETAADQLVSHERWLIFEKNPNNFFEKFVVQACRQPLPGRVESQSAYPTL